MASGNEVNFFINFIPPKPQNNANTVTKEKWQSDRNFYSCSGTSSYMSYMKTGSPKDGETDYLNYMEQERKNISLDKERSDGLFDINGQCDNEQEKTHRKNLRKTDGNIGKGVITFEKDFGEKFCTSSEQAITAMKYVFPKFIARTHLKPENVAYIGALHTNTEHYHIHFTFYEKRPMRVNAKGEASYTIKGAFADKELKYIKQSLFKHFVERSIDVYELRDRSIEHIRDNKSIYSKDSEVYKLFSQLSETKDVENEKSYTNLSKDTKLLVDKITMKIINSDPEIRRLYHSNFNRLNTAEKELRSYRIVNGDDVKIVPKLEFFRTDYFKRTGQIVLNHAKKFEEHKLLDTSRFPIMILRKGEQLNKKEQFKFKQSRKNYRGKLFKIFTNMIDKSLETHTAINHLWLKQLANEEEKEYEKNRENHKQEQSKYHDYGLSL